MKKSLALLLILTLLLSAFSFADSAQNNVGEQLKALGIIKGDPNGDLRPDSKLTREEAIVTITRLMGKEKEALATKVDPSFTDVPKDHWAKPYIAFAEMKGWTNGIGEGKFGLADNVTTQQYATYMLRVLGYGDTPYDKSMVEAAKRGLLDDVVGTKAATDITRGDVFVMMHNTLYVKPKDADKELVYVLGLKADATEEPKPEPKPEPQPAEPQGEVAVKEVVVDSLKQIKLLLTAPIDTAGDERNYNLDSEGTAVLDKNSVFELSDDKKTIIITLTKAADQQEKADLEINDLLTKDANLENIQFLDQTIPEVVSAKMVGKDKIKVVFSEPMQTASTNERSMLNKGNYVIGDGLYIDTVKAANDQSTAAIIQLYSNLKEDVKLTVKNVEDYAGYGAINKTVDVAFTVDEKAPQLVGYKTSSLNKVVLVFDEDIELAKDEKAFYHTNNGNAAKTASASGKELTLTFAKGNEMPAGTTYIYAADESIKDLWGNLLDGKQVFEITVTTDKKAPQVVGSVKVKSQRKIEIRFDEAIEKNDDFDITLLKGGELIKNDFTESISDDVLTLTFEKDLYGAYKLIIEGIQDEMANEIEKMTVSFEADDATAPTTADFKAVAYQIDSDEQLLIVRFSDKMNKSDIENRDNYKLDGKFLSDLDVSIKAVEDDEAVQIKVPKSEFDFTAANLGSNNKLLVIGQLKDAAGNKMDAFSVTVDIENGDTASIDIKEVRLVADKRVEFEVKDKLSNITTEQFVVFIDGTKADFASYKFDENKDGHTVVSFKLAEDVGTDPAADKIKYVIRNKADLASDDLKPSNNNYGQILVGSNGDVADACPPELKKIVFIDDETIYVHLTEELDAGYIAAKGKNGFSVSEGTLNKATLQGINNDVIVLTGKDFTVDTDVKYLDSNIFDLHGNELADFSFTKKLSTID